MKGTFLVIEGTDGSGKGTQFKLLVEKLEKEGYDVETFDFPQYEKESSYFVRQYLNEHYGSIEEVGPYTASIFFALDRFEAAPRIKKAIEEGKVVVANRFTGSNMAHQGTSFEASEERNGYFLWLEAIEFKMLGIPRPDLSLVLRVPADIAQKLVDQKEARSYTDRKRDLLESDINHLTRSVEVYDDLCRLFPKDFKQLDCIRGNKLLSIEAVHNLIWETIMPSLPPKKPKKNAIKNKEDKNVPYNSIKTTDYQLTLGDVSDLLMAKMLSVNSSVCSEQTSQDFDQKNADGKYRYIIPSDIDAHTKKHYVQIMDRIFDNYSKMTSELTDYVQTHSSVPKKEQDAAWSIATRAQACDVVRPVLPVANKSAVRISASDQALEKLIMYLLSDELSEARATGQKLLEEARKVTPTFLENADKPERGGAWIEYRAETAEAVKDLTDKYLPRTHSDHDEEVRLTSVWPRNELDLIPDMIYEHANYSLEEIRTDVDAWTYEQRQEVFSAYMGKRLNRRHRPSRALEKAHYSWDILCGYEIFRDLQRHRMVDDLSWQKLTPRYGYEIPQLVEDAGLADTFEECFDLSLELYGLMQAAGYDLDTQYATLLGHKMRWKITFNAREAFQLIELRPIPLGHSGYRKIALAMHEKIKEVHPMLASAMKFVNQDEDPELTRLAAERYTQF